MVALIRIEQADRDLVEPLFDKYAEELFSLGVTNSGSIAKKTTDYSLLDEYWHNKNSVPYLITDRGKTAGFSLIRRYPNDMNLNDFGQFFVLKDFRGQGIARTAFKQCVRNHPGSWLVRVLPENKGALSFWLSSVKSLTKGNFTHEIEVDVDIPMHFIRFHVAGN